MPAGASEVQVEVVGVFEQAVGYQNQDRRVPVVLLRDPLGRELHLPIGSCEGFAIHIFLERHVAPRPLTHDLALRLLEKLSARLERVVVEAVPGEASHATLRLEARGGRLEVPAHPGDAVALALRAEVPIFVDEDLLTGGEG